MRVGGLNPKSNQRLSVYSTVDLCPTLQAAMGGGAIRCLLSSRCEGGWGRMNYCVCCGRIIPEGRMVCPICEWEAGNDV